MGSPQRHSPVKLVISLLYNDETVFAQARTRLRRKFGRLDLESGPLDFSHTDYYRSELGDGLKRKFISFTKLIPPQDLPRIKLAANRLEQALSRRHLRRINIDPGYLDQAKFILATTKNYKHRIYLARGIFAEVTLFFQGGTFRPWECTYPDYRSQPCIDILNSIRSLYAEQVKNHKQAKAPQPGL